jgi:predicted NBD/HSP70 family sugar kinase
VNYLVLDVGGSSIKYSMMTKSGEFLDTGKKVTPLDSFDTFRETIGEIYDKYSSDIQGMAISMPGIIDGVTGYAYTGGALEYNENRNIVKELKERCPCNIVIENDGKCAALAEAWKGSLEYCNDGIVIVLGTGVGGGIIKNRKIHRGKHFSAGEFSYIQTNLNDSYNLEGLWGNISGNSALIKRVSEIKNIPIEELDGIKVFEYMENEDKEVLDILDRFTKNIAVQIYNLQCIYDAEKIAIGGGISANDILIEYIKKNVDEYYNILNLSIPRAEVVRCKYGNDSNKIGALYNYLVKEEKENLC